MMIRKLELASLENPVIDLRLQDKLLKQNFHQDMNKLFEPVTDTNKGTSKRVTKTMMAMSEYA